MSVNRTPDAHAPELGDWRLFGPGWVTAWNGVALPEPMSFRTSTFFRNKGGGTFSFPTPSAAALHMNSAWKAAKRASALKELLAISVHRRDGERAPNLSMGSSDQGVSDLFDYLEEMMTVAFGSYGAVEAFCNQTVIEKGSDGITVKRKKPGQKRKAEVRMAPAEVERLISTDDKIKRIVPDLLGLPTPSGTAQWEAYLKLKRFRDAVTHFKRSDQTGKTELENEATVLQNFIALDCYELPEKALSLLRFLQSSGKLNRWMVNPSWSRDPESQVT